MSRQPDEDKHQRILQAAIEVFGSQGLERATMKDIADKAGVAPGTLYTYFADKDALFIGAVDQLWDGFFAGSEAILKASNDPRSLSKMLLDYGMDTLMQLYPLVRGMIAAANRFELIHRRLDDLSRLIARSMGGLPAANSETLRIWIGGVLFLLASAPSNELPREIERLKTALTRSLETA